MTYPAKPDLLFHLGDIYESKGDTDAAVALWKELLPKSLTKHRKVSTMKQNIIPGDAGEDVAVNISFRLYQVGERLEKYEHYNDAIEAFKEVIVITPQDLDLRECLANVDMKTGNKRQMVRTYEEAIEDQPLNFRLWSMLCARGTFLTETSRAPSVSVSRE